MFLRKMLISANSAKKTYVFRKGPSFLRILRKRRTFPKGRICRFPNNSINFYEKRTNSLNVHEKHTFSETCCHFCEFCEKDARFPWVEFVHFLKIEFLLLRPSKKIRNPVLRPSLLISEFLLPVRGCSLAWLPGLAP